MAQLPPKPRAPLSLAERISTDLPSHPYERDDDKMEPGEWERDKDRDVDRPERPAYRDDAPPRDYPPRPPSPHREHERDRRGSYHPPPPADSYVTGLGRDRGSRDGDRPRDHWDRFSDSRDRDPYYRGRDTRPPPYEGRSRDSYHDYPDSRRRDGGRFPPPDSYRGPPPGRPPPDYDRRRSPPPPHRHAYPPPPSPPRRLRSPPLDRSPVRRPPPRSPPRPASSGREEGWQPDPERRARDGFKRRWSPRRPDSGYDSRRPPPEVDTYMARRNDRAEPDRDRDWTPRKRRRESLSRSRSRSRESDRRRKDIRRSRSPVTSPGRSRGPVRPPRSPSPKPKRESSVRPTPPPKDSADLHRMNEEEHASARRMEKRPERGERPHDPIQTAHIKTEMQKQSPTHTAPPIKHESQSPVVARALSPPLSHSSKALSDAGEKERYEKEKAPLAPAKYGKPPTASASAEQPKGRAVPTGPRSEVPPPPPVNKPNIPKLDPNRPPMDEFEKRMQDLNRTVARQEAIRRNLYTELAKNNIVKKRAKHEMELAEIEYMAAVARRKFICADAEV